MKGGHPCLLIDIIIKSKLASRIILKIMRLGKFTDHHNWESFCYSLVTARKVSEPEFLDSTTGQSITGNLVIGCHAEKISKLVCIECLFEYIVIKHHPDRRNRASCRVIFGITRFTVWSNAAEDMKVLELPQQSVSALQICIFGSGRRRFIFSCSFAAFNIITAPLMYLVSKNCEWTQ